MPIDGRVAADNDDGITIDMQGDRLESVSIALLSPGPAQVQAGCSQFFGDITHRQRAFPQQRVNRGIEFFRSGNVDAAET